jgi:hypothetical protein
MRLMMLFTQSPVSAIILVCCNMIVLRIRLGEVEVIYINLGTERRKKTENPERKIQRL